MIGKKNMLFGFIYFIFTLALGIFLSNQLQIGGADWANSMTRGLLKAAHVHGNLESLLNIMLGYLICRLAFKEWIAKSASALLIIGAVLHSGALYLAGMGQMWALMVTKAGAICLVAVFIIMALGVHKLESVD